MNEKKMPNLSNMIQQMYPKYLYFFFELCQKWLINISISNHESFQGIFDGEGFTELRPEMTTV